MTTATKKSMQLANAMAESGMVAQPYSRTPSGVAGSTVLRLPQNRSVIRNWVGNLATEFDVRIDKSQTQALVDLHEPKRTRTIGRNVQAVPRPTRTSSSTAG